MWAQLRLLPWGISPALERLQITTLSYMSWRDWGMVFLHSMENKKKEFAEKIDECDTARS